MEQDVWRRAEELFHAAVERSPDARGAFLDAACGGDAELRRQVERLVSDDEQVGTFLEQPIAAVGVPLGPQGALVGRQHGPYLFLSLLGAGGMGEVYRARDSRLGRDVAIKTLPREFARDPERLARLRREARVLAALNHPNIATIYGLEESLDADYLVLELVEGETPRGPLPPVIALDLACQVAEALQAAHEHGIVHRDLKPANIKVTPQGRVKVLDFGLAKATWGSEATPGVSRPGAVTRPGTMLGDVVGTPGYMSPEQARGEEVDQRTDIWAFGCLLYELLAGKRAFGRGSLADAMAGMPEDEPDWQALPADTPTGIRDVLRTCLERDANRRLARIADARAAIQAVQRPSFTAEETPRTSVNSVTTWLRPARQPRQWVLPAGVAVVVMAAVVWVAFGRFWRSGPVPAHFALTMPGATVLGPSTSSQLAVAADGRGVVYLGRNGERQQLYWHDLSGPEGWALPGTEESNTPVLSPDGMWLGFFRDGKLLKLPMRAGHVTAGSRVEEVAASGSPRGAAWSRDGTIVYGAFGGGLWQVAAAGGQPRRLTEPDASRDEADHRWPSFLPNGRDILFTVNHASWREDRGVVAVLSLDTGRITRVIDGFVYARYLPSGHLALAGDGALHALRFDPKTLKTSGRPLPVVNDVSFGVNKIDVPADVAADGSLVYVREKLAPPTGTLIWLSRDGKPEQALPERRAYEPDSFSLSPDGRRVATTIDSDGRSNIWICDLSDRLCRLLSIQADCIAPVWSPSGDRLVFSSNLEGAYNLYVVAVNGNHRPERLGPSSRMLQRPRSWSSDGRFLAYEVQGTAAPYETYILRLEGRGAPFRWGPAGAEVSEPAFSPDGRWLAYQSRESGRWEVWVRPFPGPGPSQRVSGGDGGLAPVWEGREIYYAERLGGTRIMSRRVESTAPFRLASAPRVAFALPFALSNDLFYFSLAYAVEPGGHRLLVVQPDERAPVNALNVITRWPEEVKAKLRRGSRPGS